MSTVKGRYLPQLARTTTNQSPAQAYDPQVTFNNYQQYIPTTRASFQNSTKEYDYELLTNQVFEWQWLVRMPRKWSYDRYEYEVHGVISLGDEDADTESMNTWLTTTRSIADLVELYDEGKEFIIETPEDVERIFNIIQEYTEYVGYVFNSHIYLSHRIEQNEQAKEVLADLVKMQNLANRIFPIMVSLDYDKEVQLTGIIGWMNNYANAGDERYRLHFDPYEKYGLSREDIFKKENVDEMTGLYKAVNLETTFDPHTFSKIRRFT